MNWSLIVGATSLGIAVLALLFTIASFWWLHARRGKLQVAAPRTYAYGPPKPRLRLPLAFYNAGAAARVVADLRLVAADEPTRAPMRWIANISELQPSSRNERDLATPFAVGGRQTREMVIEFGGDWCPTPGSAHRLKLQATLHPDTEWVDLTEFRWWAPQRGSSLRQYLTYRNAPRDELPLEELLPD